MRGCLSATKTPIKRQITNKSNINNRAILMNHEECWRTLWTENIYDRY